MPRNVPKIMPENAKTVVDERAGPTSAEIGKLRNRLGEEDLIRVALEVAQDGRAEDRGDDDHAEKAGVR